MNKYICIFCDERKTGDSAYLTDNKIGICKSCFNALDKTAYASPYKGTRNISYIMSPFEYTNKMRHVILNFKFSNHWAYAKLLTDLMKNYLNSYDMWDTFDYIVPVPLHKKRLRERGYNQAELLAKHISKHLNIPIHTDLVARIRSTKKQSSLARTERITNVLNSFECIGDCTKKNILLFDDICTTGSTLQACAGALKDAQMICALTLAIQIEQKLPIITY